MTNTGVGVESNLPPRRLRAYNKWLTMEEPKWSDNDYPTIDYQGYSYYSAPKQKPVKASLDEVDPELLATFEKLGIPLNEQKRLANVAVDAVFDSVSIATTFKEELGKAGVIFCSISEAVKEYPELVKKYMGSVVRQDVLARVGRVVERGAVVALCAELAWCALSLVPSLVMSTAMVHGAVHVYATTVNNARAGAHCRQLLCGPQ